MGYYPVGPNQVGVRLWHVDARLLYVDYNYYYYTIDENDYKNNFTTNPFYDDGSKYRYTEVAMTNTSDGTRETLSLFAKYYLLQLISANTSKTYTQVANLSSTDLFTAAANKRNFDMTTYKNQFPDTGVFDSGASFPFSFHINSLDSTNRTVNLNITKAS